MTQPIQELLAVVDAYMEATGYTEITVSNYALRDGKKISQLRSGVADITSKRHAKAMLWFSENWPAGKVRWPAGIKRPRPERLAGRDEDYGVSS